MTFSRMCQILFRGGVIMTCDGSLQILHQDAIPAPLGLLSVRCDFPGQFEGST